jgi:hypothetical protein
LTVRNKSSRNILSMLLKTAMKSSVLMGRSRAETGLPGNRRHFTSPQNGERRKTGSQRFYNIPVTAARGRHLKETGFPVVSATFRETFGCRAYLPIYNIFASVLARREPRKLVIWSRKRTRNEPVPSLAVRVARAACAPQRLITEKGTAVALHGSGSTAR